MFLEPKCFYLYLYDYQYWAWPTHSTHGSNNTPCNGDSRHTKVLKSHNQENYLVKLRSALILLIQIMLYNRNYFTHINQEVSLKYHICIFCKKRCQFTFQK